jgi:tyrosinase
LHFAIGGAIGFGTADEPGSVEGFTQGLMSSVPTAAFDPIFWVHHCNIDRLWSQWDCASERVWGNAPPEDWFKERPWHFYDHDLSVHNLERAAYIRHGGLSIRFDSDDPACRPLSGSLPYEVQVAAGPPPAGSAARRFTTARTEVVGRSDAPLALSAGDPVSQQLTLAPAVLGEPEGAVASIRRASPDAPRHLLLQLEGLSVAAAPSVGYDVYVNLPETASPDRANRHYVGSLALFGTAARGDAQHRMSGNHAGRHGTGSEGQGQQFDVTRAVVSDPAATSVPADKLRVTIVPFDLLTPKQGVASNPPPRRSGGVTIGALKVIAVEGRAVRP